MKITDISRNYDITAHTLRYYEKIGLLFPSYTENGYRNFSYEDIQRLNTIRDLRYFDISLPEIKDYLDNRTVELTTEMFTFEINELDKKIAELNEKKALLEERFDLMEYSKVKKHLEIEQYEAQPREIVKSEKKKTLEQDLYLELKKLHKRFENILNSSNQNNFGSIITLDQTGFSHQVFYCLSKNNSIESAEVLPGGKYAAIYYKGTHSERSEALAQLKNYIKINQLQVIGDFYEFYLIDFHETNLESEYMSRIEILINE